MKKILFLLFLIPVFCFSQTDASLNAQNDSINTETNPRNNNAHRLWRMYKNTISAKLNILNLNAPFYMNSANLDLHLASPLYITGSNLSIHTVSSGAAGIVAATGTPSGKFLRDDNTWANPSGITVNSYSPSVTSVSNINTITAGSFWYQTDGTYYNLYGYFDVYASTSGAWGNVVFDFDFPAGVTWSNTNQVIGLVSGVYTSSATTPISGVVNSKTSSSQVRCTFASFNSVNAYRVYVNVFYHP